MKIYLLRQEKEHSQSSLPVSSLWANFQQATALKTHACFYKDNLILILHTVTAQQPYVIICIFMGEPQRDHGENWSQL